MREAGTPSQITLNIPSDLRAGIIDCLYNATGDDIRADISLHRLKTRNSVPSRIWDLLNTALCEKLKAFSCMTSTTKRGPWELVIIYHPTTGYIFTIMREKRYRELHSKIRHRRRMHYLDLLVRHLHPDLLSPIGQTMLEPVRFLDEDKMLQNVHKLLQSLEMDGAVIKRHVLVLFETEGFELTNAHAIIVDSNLDIVDEELWKSFIPVRESVVSEKISNRDAPTNTPTRGLQLNQKALEKKKIAKKKKEEAETIK